MGSAHLVDVAPRVEIFPLLVGGGVVMLIAIKTDFPGALSLRGSHYAFRMGCYSAAGAGVIPIRVITSAVMSVRASASKYARLADAPWLPVVLNTTR